MWNGHATMAMDGGGYTSEHAPQVRGLGLENQVPFLSAEGAVLPPASAEFQGYRPAVGRPITPGRAAPPG